MTDKRIEKLVEFFYASDDSNDIPLRVAIVLGQYCGFNIAPDGLRSLLKILCKSKDLKADLKAFIHRLDEELRFVTLATNGKQ